MALVAGVDGCRGGWLMVRLDTATRQGEAVLASAWETLKLSGLDLVAVDMPIGLADRGPRACDLAARQLLPAPRKSSVFAPPRRYMLACPDWRTAQQAGRNREGVGLSKQSWNLVPKIAEIDRHVAPADQTWLREVHPELVFHSLNAWHALAPKKTAAGAAERRRLLDRQAVALSWEALGVPRSRAAPDDLLDAAACALAAERILAGRGHCLPPEPDRDRRGLKMEIWY